MFSLDRNKSSGWFSRSGLAWYVSVLLSAGAPETPDDIESLFDRYFEECQSILRRSEALKDLDLDTEAGVHAAAERVINTDHLRDSIEYWAIGEGAALADTVAALADGDTQRVAWAMNRLTNAHAMVVFKRNLENILWRGYLADGLREMLQIWRDNPHNSKEEFWQQTLAGPPMILSQAFAVPIMILKSMAKVGGGGIENTHDMITDFLVRNPLSDNTALVEIKTPTTQLLYKNPYRPGVYGISKDVSGAIVQVEAQRDTLLREYLVKKHNSAAEFKAFSPHGLVIVGNLGEQLIETEQRRSFELFRQGLRDVQIVTFDELFSKIGSLLSSLGSEQSPASP